MTKIKHTQSAVDEDKAISDYLAAQGRSPLDSLFTYAGDDMHQRWPHRYQSTAEYEDRLTKEVKAHIDLLPRPLRKHLKLLIDRYAERRGPAPVSGDAGDTAAVENGVKL